MNPLVKLLRWCREHVPDGRVSMCRVENISPCLKVCGGCLEVERRALAAEKDETDGRCPPRAAYPEPYSRPLGVTVPHKAPHIL